MNSIYKATLSKGDVLIFTLAMVTSRQSSNKTNTSISITRRYVQTVPKHVHVDTSYASRFAKWAKTRDKGTKKPFVLCDEQDLWTQTFQRDLIFRSLI